MNNTSIPLEITGKGLLGGLTQQTFLANYWQKRPLLIRKALPDFASPITPDELAGLACEEAVESRLVIEKDGPSPWHLEHGPFDEQRFIHLPETHWSLLVQSCEKFVPELAELLEQFNFIPHWRIDDIMASYAPYQGSVGPHVDQYDVFLIQAHGRRRWQISTKPIPPDNFISDIDLNILRDFKVEHEWIVEPGDMLYLPPGVAHFGVALEDCITLSVGFRAPSHVEIISSYLEDAIARTDPKARYADPDLVQQAHPGEITARSLQQVRSIVRASVASNEAIDEWFGQYVTEPKVDFFSQDEDLLLIPQLTPSSFASMFEECGILERHPDCRFAFIQHPEQTTLFINGEKFRLSSDLSDAAAIVADQPQISYEQLADDLQNPALLELLTELHNTGYITLPETGFNLQKVAWDEAETQLRDLRTTVFIQEQKVPPELEWDEADRHCLHLLATNQQGEAIGTVRLLDDGHIGRLAVLPEWRNKGIGRALMLAALKIARSQAISTVQLNAQTQVLDFYQRLGFSVDSEEFMDAGIPHRHMTLELS